MRNSLSSLKVFQFWMTLLLSVLVVMYYVQLRGEKREELLVTDALQTEYSSILYPSDNPHKRNPLQVAHGSLQRDRRSRHSKRFILSLNYWEQFTMATINLMSLVCLGSWWNATTVQPFTFNSRLYGLQNFKPGIKWEMYYFVMLPF